MVNPPTENETEVESPNPNPDQSNNPNASSSVIGLPPNPDQPNNHNASSSVIGLPRITVQLTQWNIYEPTKSGVNFDFYFNKILYQFSRKVDLNTFKLSKYKATVKIFRGCAIVFQCTRDIWCIRNLYLELHSWSFDIDKWLAERPPQGYDYKVQKTPPDWK